MSSGDNKKQVLDLSDRQKAFQEVDERLNALRDGFYALATDYGFHIENTWGKHKIFELRDNVIYRFFSSLFHLQLLLERHYVIEHRFKKLLNESPKEILDPIYPKNPHFEYAEKEVTALLDSIVFHLASVYDYMAILASFITTNNKDESPSWSTLSKKCNDKTNPFSSKSIAQVIIGINRALAIKLYDYRSDLIHRKKDAYNYSVTLQLSQGDFTIKFICSERLRKAFKTFGEKERDYTINYFAVWLINHVADSIGELLVGLKKEIEANSTFPNHIMDDDGDKPFIVMVDPETNVAQSPSAYSWDIFKKHFKYPG